MPNTATPKNSTLPTPTAPIASGPSRPTMARSTTPMAIQPNSATTTGVASLAIGGSSARRLASVELIQWSYKLCPARGRSARRRTTAGIPGETGQQQDETSENGGGGSG